MILLPMPSTYIYTDLKFVVSTKIRLQWIAGFYWLFCRLSHFTRRWFPSLSPLKIHRDQLPSTEMKFLFLFFFLFQVNVVNHRKKKRGWIILLGYLGHSAGCGIIRNWPTCRKDDTLWTCSPEYFRNGVSFSVTLGRVFYERIRLYYIDVLCASPVDPPAPFNKYLEKPGGRCSFLYKSCWCIISSAVYISNQLRWIILFD
jgi:hypothetical protein